MFLKKGAKYIQTFRTNKHFCFTFNVSELNGLFADDDVNMTTTPPRQKKEKICNSEVTFFWTVSSLLWNYCVI